MYEYMNFTAEFIHILFSRYTAHYIDYSEVSSPCLCEDITVCHIT